MDDKYVKLRDQIDQIIDEESSVCVPVTLALGKVIFGVMQGLTSRQQTVVLAALTSSILDIEEDVEKAGAMLAYFYIMRKKSEDPNN